LYIGGSEHATGHLLYSRFWNKFLKDLGLVPEEEFAKKLINQGMIQGRSNFVYRVNIIQKTKNDSEQFEENVFLSLEYYNKFINGELSNLDLAKIAYKELFEPIQSDEENENHFDIIETHKILIQDIIDGKIKLILVKLNVDVNIVDNDILNIEAFKNKTLNKSWQPGYENSKFIFEENGSNKGKYVCGFEIDKMSKRWHNVVNPDILVDKVGADTLRLYEMFLGPLEQAKPWNTNGIDGSFRFIKKVWRLFYDDQSNFKVKDEAPTPAELKVLHTAIKKVEEDLERYSFNTVVSTLMICVNDLGSLKCAKKSILQELVILMSPYTPHMAEELWTLLGNEAGTISYASFPKFNPIYLVEANFEYPISINGKVRANISFPTDALPADIEAGVLANEIVQKWLEGKAPKKVIVVPKRIVNVVP